MKLLVFEFATASGLNDPAISTEGRAMLGGLLDDLKELDVDYLMSKNSNSTVYMDNEPYNSLCNPIFIENNLTDWLEENVVSYDACLPIAPEEDFVLHKITKIIEEKGVKVVGSSSDSVMVCSNKHLTYVALKDKLPFIKTEQIFFDKIDEYNDLFEDNKRKIVKPAEGVSCSGIHVINSFDKLKEASHNIKTGLPYFLVQDFMEGTPASVSILSDGKTVLPLSLNFQSINIEYNKIEYNGGYVPLEHEQENEAKRVAKKAVESIKGLKGYVGVDLILNDDVHLVEINSRITTPYVALTHILNFNLGEAIVNSVYGHLPHDIILNGKVEFEKKGVIMKIRRLIP